LLVVDPKKRMRKRKRIAKVCDISMLQHTDHDPHYAHTWPSHFDSKARRSCRDFVTEGKMRNGATSAEDPTKFRSSDLEIRWDCIHWLWFADVDRLGSCWWDFSGQSMSEGEKEKLVIGSICLLLLCNTAGAAILVSFAPGQSLAALSWIRLVQVEGGSASTLR
jgi:hypothetical protein